MLPLKMSRCRESSLNVLVLVFVSGAVSLSQVGVAFNVLDLNVVDTYWCVGCYHLIVFDFFIFPDCHFHQLITVAFIVAHVVY